MLDKPNKDDVTFTAVDNTAPAVFVRMNSQVGPNSTIEMSFGVPLAMTQEDLNKYIDKVMACSERQSDKKMLEQARLALKGAHRDLSTNQSHRASYEAKQAASWDVSGRRGDWSPSGAETKQLQNFDVTDGNLRENIIPRLEKDIAELEEKTK